jgi:hypothetical protein
MTMEEHRLTGTIGAEITRIDLRQPISDDLAERLRQARGGTPSMSGSHTG